MKTIGILGLLLIVGCDGAGETFSCSTTLPGTETPGPLLCIEGTGGTSQDLANNRQQCIAQGNTFSRSPCTHVNAVGGCRQSKGSTSITTWYYQDGNTAVSDIREICEGLAGFNLPGMSITFVLPDSLPGLEGI